MLPVYNFGIYKKYVICLADDKIELADNKGTFQTFFYIKYSYTIYDFSLKLNTKNTKKKILKQNAENWSYKKELYNRSWI